MSFFNTSLTQLFDDERERIQHIAIATRGAKTEDFSAFLKSFDKQVEKHNNDSHKANIDMLNQKL